VARKGGKEANEMFTTPIKVKKNRGKGIIILWDLYVPDSKSRNIPEVVFVWRWAVGVLGIWREWDSWVKGGANGVSLQAT
jgi:hypothetical protein